MAHQGEHQVVQGSGGQQEDQDGEEQSPDEQLPEEGALASAGASCQKQLQQHWPHPCCPPNQAHPVTEQKGMPAGGTLAS